MTSGEMEFIRLHSDEYTVVAIAKKMKRHIAAIIKYYDYSFSAADKKTTMPDFLHWIPALQAARQMRDEAKPIVIAPPPKAPIIQMETFVKREMISSEQPIKILTPKAIKAKELNWSKLKKVAVKNYSEPKHEEQKVFIRPKAVYTNVPSWFGISDQQHGKHLIESAPDKNSMYSKYAIR